MSVSTSIAAAAAAAFCLAAAAAFAQAPQVHSQNGVEYINGGAGEEARADIDAERPVYPLRIVFSVLGGAFAIADHVVVSRGGTKLLGIDDVGPLLLVKAGPGDYLVEATYKGKTQRREIKVGSAATTVDWRLDEEPKRP